MEKDRAPKENKLIVVAVAVEIAVNGGHIEAAEVFLRLQFIGVGEGNRVEIEILDARVLVALVALVGRDVIGLPADFVTGDAVGLVHAEDGPILNIDGIVAVAGVEAVSGRVVILHAQRQNTGDSGRRDIDHGNRVVFLKGRDRRHAVGGNGDKFRLHVLGHGFSLEDPHSERSKGVFLTIEGREVGRRDRGAAHPGRNVNDADGSVGIDVVIEVPLIGHQDFLAIGRERQHIGLRSHLDAVLKIAIRVEKQHVSGVGFGVRRHGDRDDAVVDGDTGRRETVERRRKVQGEKLCRVRRIGDAHHIDGFVEPVGDEQPLRRRIVGNDFGGPFVENAGAIACDWIELNTHGLDPLGDGYRPRRRRRGSAE